MRKRYIFDLDGTLLSADWTTTDQYFLDTFGEQAKPFLDNMSNLLAVYERRFQRYNYADLSQYLASQTDLPITPQDIQAWDQLVGEVRDTPEDKVFETLEFLKNNGVSLAVLTNWFEESQSARLEKIGLRDYFETVYGGDTVTKPHKEAYYLSTAAYSPEECVFIGDNVDNDYIGPKACGMDAILYDKKDRHHKTLRKVRNLKELMIRDK